jgi:hypothetical protein
MAFEVASIRPSKPGTFIPPSFPLDAGDAYAATGGRFSGDFQLATYIKFAYKLMLTPDQKQSMIAPLAKMGRFGPVPHSGARERQSNERSNALGPMQILVIDHIERPTEN